MAVVHRATMKRSKRDRDASSHLVIRAGAKRGRKPMHGEYKTPGGKLIAVDFDVRDGTLRDVAITGDFFLYPDEALSLLTGALEGASVELSEAELAQEVRVAMPRDAELLGSSPEAIGAAVRRALAADADASDDA